MLKACNPLVCSVDGPHCSARAALLLNGPPEPFSAREQKARMWEEGKHTACLSVPGLMDTNWGLIINIKLLHIFLTADEPGSVFWSDVLIRALFI